MPHIFLSYRRADAAGTAGRLYDRLSQHFGTEQVFRDIDSIEAGDDFEQSIRDALRVVSVVIVVIGPRWLDLRRDDGMRRLDDPLDYVRREIEMALSADTIVIPVLVENAAMPATKRLPASIRELTKRNAIELTHRGWENDVKEFIRRLEARGISSAEPDESDAPVTKTVTCGRALASALLRFVPNLFSLLYQPRRFLARCTQGRASDLAGAFVFFVLTLVLAIAILVSAYTPQHSLLGFGLAVFSTGLLVTVSLSAVLWVAWRLVGATRHYFRLLVVLLHQMAILHLIVFVVMWILIVGVDLRSRNIVRKVLDEAMKPGSSTSTALESMRGMLAPLADASEVRVALGLAGIVLLSGVIWIIQSWGAYRDAFDLGRARAIAALILAVSLIWAILALISRLG